MFKYDRNRFWIMETCKHWFSERNLVIVTVGNHGNNRVYSRAPSYKGH